MGGKLAGCTTTEALNYNEFVQTDIYNCQFADACPVLSGKETVDKRPYMILDTRKADDVARTGKLPCATQYHYEDEGFLDYIAEWVQGTRPSRSRFTVVPATGPVRPSRNYGKTGTPT